MLNTYRTFQNQHPNVEKYCHLLDQYGPYRFFATLSFQYFLSEKQAVDSASQVVMALHRKLSGLEWPINATPVTPCPIPRGIAVLEKANIRKRLKGSPQSIKDRGNHHFHFLLHGHPKLSPDPNRAVWELGKAWREIAGSLNYKRTKRLVSVNGTDVQLVATTDVIGYVLKEAKNWGWKDEERLFFLDGEGLIPIDLSYL